MTKTQSIPKDIYDRLRNVAFWYWEYQRRNNQYRRWSSVVECFIEYFDSIGELERMDSQETLEECLAHEKELETIFDYFDTPFCRHLVEEHGIEAKRKYIKMCFLGAKFDQKFKRVFRHHCDGIDTDLALEAILNQHDVSFETERVGDLSALLVMHEDWIVQIDGDVPTPILSLLEVSATLPFNPDIKPEQLENIGKEYQVLNLFNKAVKEVFEDQFLDYSTAEAAYKLSIAGRHINNSDLVRLAVLWMWDRADESNPNDVETGFPAALEALQTKLDEKGMGAEKAFNQFFTRRKRILGYFKATNKCIEEMNVFNLND